MPLNTINIRPPYLVFTGNEARQSYAKTAAGIVQWRPELCAGHLHTRSPGVDLGLPRMSLEQAREAGVGSLIVGTANIGGGLPEDWIEIFDQALNLGIDVVGGLHSPLNHVPQLVAAAKTSGSRLVDVRVPPSELPVGLGTKRRGKRLLTVGTDCAVGKKYAALALERDMRAANITANFRASGQTGIMIAGRGIPIDAVVTDFISGAAECLSPENDDDHWDVIEGQGGIFHPGYAAVSLGLLIGSQPDAIVACHEAGRTHIEGWPDFKLPTIQQVIDRTIDLAGLTNPDARCVGISVNTSRLAESERPPYLKALSEQYGLPCVDPIETGTRAIVDAIKQHFTT